MGEALAPEPRLKWALPEKRSGGSAGYAFAVSWYNRRECRSVEHMEMTAAKILQLNGDIMSNSPMMEVVRRFHALSSSRQLVGGANTSGRI